MKNTFKILNQLYYLMYTTIILLTISGYFLNLNNLLNIDIQKSVEMVLLSFLMLITLMAVSFFGYFLFASKRLRNIHVDDEREKQYLKSAKIRLLLIGASLILGVVCLYLVRSEIVLYLIAVSAILLLLSKPNESKINEILSK